MCRNAKGQFIKGSHSSIRTEFKKGNIPFNKGMKRDKWMTLEKQLACEKTQYKKGNLPMSANPVGHVSCHKHRRHGQIVGYDWFINIDWQGNRYHGYPYRKYLWETFYNEEAPKGMIFIAKDGDQAKKPTIENIEMISRAENMRRNSPNSQR